MHSEHLRNVQLSWIAFGWFIALSVAASVILLLLGAGLVGGNRGGAPAGLALAVAVGWLVGGFITGFKTAAAPILHGAAIALFTFVAWFLLNLLFGGLTTGTQAWEFLNARATAVALLAQAVAAIAGCWLGYRYTPLRIE
ncbi:MAG: hypothetical protein ACE5HF_10830 [Gemmatimonadota bacterium]